MGEGRGLSIYEAACSAVAAARKIDEVLEEASKARAMMEYARQVKNRSLEVDAAEIRIRAKRRLGELLVEQKAGAGMAKGGKPYQRTLMSISAEERVPTLDELGIDRKTSAEAQKMAAVESEQFEFMVSDWRGRVADESERVVANLLKEGEKAQNRAAHAAATVDGCTVDDLHELIARERQFGAIVADPAWHYRVRSDRGEDRSASQHYDLQSVEEIIDLPISKLAARDCALFLWVMDWDPDLSMARTIIAAWGFKHVTTAFTWVKLNRSGVGFHMGLGHWTRANPETCLLCTRGNPERLNRDVRQLIVAPVMEHSRKPDEALESVERLVPGAYLELNARRRREGWTNWGNEIARKEFESEEVSTVE